MAKGENKAFVGVCGLCDWRGPGRSQDGAAFQDAHEHYGQQHPDYQSNPTPHTGTYGPERIRETGNT